MNSSSRCRSTCEKCRAMGQILGRFRYQKASRHRTSNCVKGIVPEGTRRRTLLGSDQSVRRRARHTNPTRQRGHRPPHSKDRRFRKLVRCIRYLSSHHAPREEPHCYPEREIGHITRSVMATYHGEPMEPASKKSLRPPESDGVLQRFPTIVFWALALLAFTFLMYNGPNWRQPSEISYTKFLELVNQSQVVE